jgi:two-component system cell cycle sensor histidine kinase/response regulator CckA
MVGGNRVGEIGGDERAFTEIALNAQLDTFFVFDPTSGRAVRWNRAFEEVTGYSHAEIDAQKAPDAYYGPDDLVRAAACLKLVVKAGRGRVELALICKDGRRIPTEYEVSVMDDVDGTARYVVAVGRDISARRQAEAELNQVRHMVASSWDMIALLDRDFQYLGANEAYAAAFGMTTADVIGHAVTDLYGGAFFERVIKPHGDACLAGNSVRYEAWFEFPVGRCYMDVAYSPFRSPEGEITGLVVIARDISSRKQAEVRERKLNAKLVRAERAESRGVLAGGVAHDLNNALGPMVALPDIVIERLRELALGPSAELDKIEELLSLIKSSAGRSAEVVRNLVQLGRRGELVMEPVDLNKIPCLQSSCNCAKNLRGGEQAIRFDSQLADGELRVMGNRVELQRLFSNLVHNAAESIAGEGKVTVSSSAVQLDEPTGSYELIPAGAYALVRVVDSGHGIDADNLNHIFEPFYSRKLATDETGSGLGLAIVHGVLKDHGGFVDVASRPGQGTQFSLYFPLHASSPVPQPMAAVAAPPMVGTGACILIVDDESAQRVVCRCSLEGLGYSVLEADSGKQALEFFAVPQAAAADSPIDLVVLDMVLGSGCDGLETYQAIQKRYPNQKVLIVSGHAHGDHVQRARAMGADWLAKPYARGALVKAVQARLSRP